MTNFRNIPIAFLRSWAATKFLHKNFMNDLANLSPDLATVGDVLDMKGPEFQSFRYRLRDCQEDLVALYRLCADFSAEASAAVEENRTAEDEIRSFVRAFVNFGRAASTAVGKSFAYQFDGMEKMYLYNPYDPTVYDLEALSKASGYTREMFRITFKNDLMPECKKILMGEDQWMAAPAGMKELTGELRALVDGKHVVMFEALPQALQDADTKSLAFVTEVLGFDMYNPQGSLFEPMLVDGDWCGLTALNGVDGFVRKFLSDHQAGISWQYGFLPALQKHIAKKTTLLKGHLQEMVKEILLSSDRFDVKQVEGSEDFIVSMKWKFLDDVQARAERILYHHALETPEHPSMSRNEIIEAYNVLARMAGIPELTEEQSFLKRKKHMAPIGKTGYWKYVDDGMKKEISARDFIKNYVLEHEGVVSLSEVVEAMAQAGYKNKKSGIRTYITNLCYTVLGEDDLFVYKDFADRYADERGYEYDMCRSRIDDKVLSAVVAILMAAPGRKMRFCQLTKALTEHTQVPISETSLRYMLSGELKDSFLVTSSDRKCYVELIAADPAAVVRKAEVREKPEYYRLIRQMAVELLRDAGGELQLRTLVSNTRKFVPMKIARNNIYKVYQDEAIFHKEVRDKITYVKLDASLYKKEYTDKEERIVPEAPVPTPNVHHEEVYTSRANENAPVALDWNLLKALLAGQFSNIELGRVDIDEVLEKMYHIMGNGRAPRLGGEYWKMLSNIQQLYTGRTSPNDRELLASKLSLGLENYLKNLYRMTVGEEMEETSGLGGVINVMQREELLPKRNDYSNSLTRALNDKARKVIGIRNHVAHAAFDEAPTLEGVIMNIRHTFEYYLLVAAWNL